mgnify:FL=1
MGHEKPKAKQFLGTITTGASSAINQSEFLATTCNLVKAREKNHCLKNWGDVFWPITERSNHNHVITFDSHLKTGATLPSSF